MKSIKLKIKNKKNIYPIIIGNNLLRFFYKILKKNSLDFNQCLIVVDKKVPKILLPN